MLKKRVVSHWMIYGLLLLLGIPSVWAVDCYWQGGGNDTSWFTATNWRDGQVPQSNADVAYFPANTPQTVVVDRDMTVKAVYLRNPDMQLIVAAGCNLHFSNSGGLVLQAEEDAVIDGAGTITFSDIGDNGVDYADTRVMSGKTLEIAAKITGRGFEFNGGGGTIYLSNNANDFTGLVNLSGGGTVRIDSIAAVGQPSPLGTADAIVFASSTVLEYTGGSATTDRELWQRCGNGVDATVRHSGTGVLTFTGAIKSDNSSYKAFIFDITDAAATIAVSGRIHDDNNGALWLHTIGSGTLAISNTGNSWRGESHIYDGTLAVTASGAFSAQSELRLHGGRALFNTENSNAAFSDTINKMAVMGGRSTLEVAAETTGGELKIENFTYMDGLLDFRAPGLGSDYLITIEGWSPGLMEPWASVQAGTARATYDAVNGVTAASLTTQSLAALGPASIQNDDNSRAVIDSVGTDGGIYLATNPTGVAQLEQTVATDALVTLSGYKFIAPYISLQDGAANLTIGASHGDGTLVPADAILKLENQSTSGSRITINAAIDNTLDKATKIFKSGIGDVELAGPLSHTGGTTITEGTLHLNVPENETVALSGGVISGVGNLTKSGKGLLELPNVANTYEGTTTIKQGVVRVLHNNTLGSKTGSTVIEDGGALDIWGTGDNSLALGAEHIYAEGAGHDDQGAIRNTGTRSQFNAISLLTLTDDLTINTGKRLDVRNRDGHRTLDLAGHSITKVGGDIFGLTDANVINDQGTAFIDVQAGTLTFEMGTTLAGGSSNEIKIRNGAKFDFYNLLQPPTWSLALYDGSLVNVRTGNGDTINRWGGPVTLLGTSTFTGDNYTADHYTGVIGGSGKLVKDSDMHNITYLWNNANNWSGGTTVKKGVLYAAEPGTLDLGNTEVVETGSLTLRIQDTAATEPGYPLSDIYTWAQDVNLFKDSTTSLGLDTRYEDATYAAAWKGYGIRKFGPYALTLAPDNNKVRGITVYEGTLDLSNVSSDRDTESLLIGMDKSTAKDPARLIVGGNNSYDALDKGYNVGDQPSLQVGGAGRGELYVSGDAKISGRLIVGEQADAAGAVWQSGGLVHNTGGAANDGRIGYSGYGYYNLSGGICTNNGYTQLGRDANSVGILEITGGSFDYSGVYGGSFGISRGGVGLVHMSGGTFNSTPTLWIGDASDNNTTGGTALFNVTGDAEVNISAPIDMGNRNNMVSMLNLKGGVVTTKRVYRHGRDNTVATVNFNGGTLRLLNPDRTEVFGYDRYVDVFVHGGGATFDVAQADKVLAVNTPLLTPPDLGLVEIPVASAGEGYMGAPFVRITGDSIGHGAAAYAHIDPITRKVTSIEVVSPGSFRAMPVIELVGGSPKQAAVLGTAVMGLNTASGSLTKKGPGTIVLNKANTYGGTTRVEEGTLKMGAIDAMPTGSAIDVAGGTLDLGGAVITPSEIELSSGRIINGTINTPRLEKSGADTVELSSRIIWDGSTLQKNSLTPGLWEGMVRSNWDTTTPNPKTGLQLTTRAAIGPKESNETYAGGMWDGNNHTWIYSGYVWNHSDSNVTWSFRARFDDNWGLWLNGAQIQSGGNNLRIFDVVLAPGPHAIELRFGDGSGDAGPTDEPFGIAFDPQGRASDNRDDYQQLLDPGDGSLFTIDLPQYSGPGLMESFMAGGWYDEGAGASLAPQLTTRAGNGDKVHRDTYASGLWRGSNYTWVYKGILWNREEHDVTWKWCLTFDDYVQLKIDDQLIGQYGQGAPFYQEHTLTPGPHTIEIRFGDTGGQAGPNDLWAGGLTYDPTNSGSTDPADYILLQDPGDGSLLTTDITAGSGSSAAPRPVVDVLDGTLLVQATAQPGLLEGRLSGAFNKSEANPGTSIELTTTSANGSCGEDGSINGKHWPNDSTYVYSGFLWNRADHDVTWTFAKNFDDNTLLIIDGVTYIDNSSWETIVKAQVTLTPGPHSFEVRFGQGGGGAGLPGGDSGGWMQGGPGSFVVDKQGRDSEEITNYTALIDPGDGSLLSVTMLDPLLNNEGPLNEAHVQLAAGATLDLAGTTQDIAAISGSGTIINGALAAGNVYQVKCDNGSITPLTLNQVDLSNWTFVPADAASANPGGVSYVVASGIFDGMPALDGFAKEYKLVKRGQELKLIKPSGTILIMR